MCHSVYHLNVFLYVVFPMKRFFQMYLQMIRGLFDFPIEVVKENGVLMITVFVCAVWNIYFWESIAERFDYTIPSSLMAMVVLFFPQMIIGSLYVNYEKWRVTE